MARRTTIRNFLESLPGEKHVVFESRWSWAKLNDLLESIPCVAILTLSHLYKTGIIDLPRQLCKMGVGERRSRFPAANGYGIPK